MKEKIERFSKGDFEYELPFICLSEDEIRITVEAGSSYQGSFTVSNSMDREMKGVLYSSNRLLEIAENSFQGVLSTVAFQFHADYLKAGEVIQGEISVVSDCGELLLPFYVHIEAACVTTSLGKIKDLFQFTNLARMDWSEAKKVFRMEEFERIFLGNEERYRFIYRNLIKSITTSQALEEFLIAIHKKAMIHLSIDKTKVEYLVTEENISDKLILTKDHWGYAEIRVGTTAPFIILEQKFVWADRFIGNTHQISYTIDSKNLRGGINFGQIMIKTVYQTLTIDVICRGSKQVTVSQHRMIQRLELGLMDNYLNFRLNKINLDHYVLETESLLDELPDREDSRLKGLIRVHLALAVGNQKKAEEELDHFQREEAILKRNSIVEYCAYLYLKALVLKEDGVIKETAKTIRGYYESGNDDWRLLWFLLNVDSGYRNNGSRKLSDIKEQYEAGCHSPILYYEAVCIYNQDPVLLRELNEFEIQILHYGIKNWILSKELAQQYSYHASKRKTYHPVIYQGLIKLYDEYGDIETLSVICSLLIKGLKKSEKYHEWYRLGVESQLRITELYEYYMYSISYTMQEPLSLPVLLYFIYNSNLSDKKKAFLYANIIRHKDQNEPIYRSYLKRMELFSVKMLGAHQISNDLAILYQEFVTKGMLNSELSGHLPYVMYRHELSCENENIVTVKVVHKELGIEELQPLIQGRAQIDIFTSNAEIFLIDSFGNYYIESVDYSVTTYLNTEEYENHCLEYSTNPMLLLHLFDRYQNYRILHEKAIALRKQVLQIENLAKEYITDCYQTLIEYYYENYNDELLEFYISQLDLHSIKPTERAKYIEYMVVRKIYDRALYALKFFGFEGITTNRLVKMCSGWMLTPDAENKNILMVELCYYVFAHGKYDEAILHYLVQYYEGATREMYKLWKAAKSFDLGTHSLEEHMLTHMLFTQNYMEESSVVFLEYYKDVTNHTLVRAFLSYYAYNYLVHEHVIHSELFLVMKREQNYEENEICLLAWLKHNAHNKKLTENELGFVEFHIARFVKKNIILPFFAEYRSRVALPERLLDKCYITYITDPHCQVYIHYRLMKDQEPDFITERMVNVFMGIHVKEFVLFYHETVQYYITEGYSEEEEITESFYAQYDCESSEEEDGRFGQINLMLMALEVKDDDTLINIMENYIQKEYLAEACFAPIHFEDQ
ncbi:MAG: hypothetical protein H6Q59_589 [Firmicutes bacterium]|nr:hypothetical protein [Bacillota bacterium]